MQWYIVQADCVANTASCDTKRDNSEVFYWFSHKLTPKNIELKKHIWDSSYNEKKFNCAMQKGSFAWNFETI